MKNPLLAVRLDTSPDGLTTLSFFFGPTWGKAIGHHTAFGGAGHEEQSSALDVAHSLRRLAAMIEKEASAAPVQPMTKT